MSEYTIHNGDCLEVLKTLEANSVDACVTDPPYELGFMGKSWDSTGIAYNVDLWREVFRVLKPGGHLLAFGGSRTYHRMACAIEDAGFEIRDQIQWIYGSGFPKSLDVSKQLDLMAKNEWLNLSKAFDNISKNEIISLWKTASKTVKFAERSSLKNAIVIGIATPKNDSVQSDVPLKINPERLPLDVIIAELNLNEALPMRTGRDSIVPGNAGAITIPSHSLVITVESLLESPSLKPCLINSIAQCGVRASQNGSTAETIKDDEALRTWLGKSKSLNSQDVNALSAGLIDGLKLTILNHSKTFQSLDTIFQTACVSAITVTITESTAVSLISFTVDTLKAKAIDKAAGAEREVVGTTVSGKILRSNGDNERPYQQGKTRIEQNVTVAASDDAKTWSGFGTALKPANEPICMARKPLEKGLTVAQNVLKWGTGAINIDGCRVGYASPHDKQTAHVNALGPVERFKTTKPIYEGGKQNGGFADTHSSLGRFPANVIHDGSDEVLARFPETTSGGGNKANIQPKARESQVLSTIDGGDWDANTGSASRFFYCAKASKSDRNGGLDGFPVDRPDSRTAIGMGTFEEKGVQPQQNHHPTVKPVDLMQYLCRLVTPPSGTVLDPFLGSGSTAKAALIERFKVIGIELEPEYVKIAEARCKQLQVKLF